MKFKCDKCNSIYNKSQKYIEADCPNIMKGIGDVPIIPCDGILIEAKILEEIEAIGSYNKDVFGIK